jgi:hypothetical protein
MASRPPVAAAGKGQQLSTQKAQPSIPMKVAPDAVEARPQPSATKVAICTEMTAGRAVSFNGVPQAVNQGDIYGLNYNYGQASAGTSQQ